MIEEAGRDKQAQELRKRAEKLVSSRKTPLPAPVSEDIQKMIHELEVHQVELEMQNEELRRTQTQLQETGHRYLDLYDFAPVGYLTVDKHNLIREANLTAGGLLGIERSKLIGTRFTVFIVPQSAESYYLHRRAALKTQIRQTCELRMLKQDGAPFEAELQSLPVGDSGQLRIALTDITRRKQLQEEVRVYQQKETVRIADIAIKQSEEKYRRIVETANEGIMIADISGTITFVNPRMAEMLGYSADEMVGKPGLDFVDPSERPAGSVRTEQRKRGTSESYDIKFRHKNGKEVWLHASGTPIKDDKGKHNGNLAMYTDITERKQAEEALLKSKTELEAVFESMTDAVFVSDIQGNFIDFNEAFATFHLFKNKEECYKTLAEYPDYIDVYFPDGTLAALDMWAVPRALRGETVSYAEYILRRKDTGEKWWGSYSFGPIRDKAGKITGSVVVGRDITERKKAEEELKGYKEHLEQLVQDKTAALETANRDLQAVNEELEAFSYSVSHDLKAPLRSLTGFSNIVLEDYADKLGAEGKESLQRISAASQLMARLIDDILNLSRVTRAPMDVGTVNLSELAARVSEELKKSQPERRVEFKIAPDLIDRGDRNLLKLVLDNLLGNAFKFTSKSPQPVIEFGMNKEKDGPVYFVRDNGAGFDMAYADKLFKPFRRLHSEKDFPGTGIGLASVQRTIHRHGGRVWAEGKKGKGAAFYFTL